MDEPDVEVAQKINPARLVQQNLEALNAATTPYRAAHAVVRLYQNLHGLMAIDATFAQEWGEVLDGKLLDIASSPQGWLNIRWSHVWAGQRCLLRLMERHGMGFQALLQDEVAAAAVRNESDLADDDGEVADG